MKKQKGQTTVFFAFILTGLLVMTAVGAELGRIVYAKAEVQKAADAASLAAASRIDVSLYRETGEVRFLPDVYAVAQSYASMNSALLQSRHVRITVIGISLDPVSMAVSVSVVADLTPVMPAVLAFQGLYQVTGSAEGRIDGR